VYVYIYILVYIIYTYIHIQTDKTNVRRNDEQMVTAAYINTCCRLKRKTEEGKRKPRQFSLIRLRVVETETRNQFWDEMMGSSI
jgi:hypothetical protein